MLELSELKRKTEVIYSQINFERINAFLGERSFDKYCAAATYPPLKSLESFNSKSILAQNKLLTNHPVNLYVHFPFCAQLCSFCHFNVAVNRNPETHSQYVDHLIQEIEMHKDLVTANSIVNIIFGGGTPSLMALRDVERILKKITSLNPSSKAAEVFFEIHPKKNLLDTHYLEQLKNLGIDNISIGIQDFDDEILKIINRGHDQDEAIQIVKHAKDIGLQLNIDLMTPLPKQTFDSWASSLKIIGELHPEQVTLNITSIRKSMGIYRDLKSEDFPSADDSFRFVIAAQVWLASCGYTETSPLKFRKKTQVKPVNSPPVANYFSHSTIAFGAGAYSTHPTQFYYNIPTVREYQNSIANQQLPLFMSIEIDPLESLHREMVFFVRKGKVNLGELQSRYGLNAQELFQEQIKALMELELVELHENTLRMTKIGNLFRDEIAKVFVSKSVLDKIQNNSTPSRTVAHLNHFYEL